MGEAVGDPKVWFPSQFLTNDDPLMDKENLNKSGVNAGFALGFSFPTEFPYEFESFGTNSSLSSPVESVAGSTENEGSDEEEFFAGLTRRLTQFSLPETQKLAVKPSLPQNKPEVTSFFLKESFAFSFIFSLCFREPSCDTSNFLDSVGHGRVSPVDSERNRELVRSQCCIEQWKLKWSLSVPVSSYDAFWC
jgi:hypothetical protein